MNAPRSITIIVRGPNDFDVHVGERYASRLQWDEMLGAVAELTHGALGQPSGRFETPEERNARESRMRTAGMRL